MSDLVVRAVVPTDRVRVVALLMAEWGGGTEVAGHGVLYDAAELPGLLAERDGEVVGLLTYQVADGALEVVTINAPARHAGVGTALLAAAVDVARELTLDRVWLVTTNDNLDALRFYQRRGMRIAAVAPGAVDAARVLKPGIPTVGAYGIGMHDELTLELRL
jgi:ribosomal protein S18 acetylase RimI-like enzyme